MKLVTICIFVLLQFNVLGQLNEIDQSIVIDRGKSILYSKDASNLVVIELTIDSIQNYIFKTSQGKLHNLDSGVINGMFLLTDLEIGKVTVSVFRKDAKGLMLKAFKEYRVVKRPLSDEEKRIKAFKIQPVLSIDGYERGKIPLSVLKNAEGFTINKPYKVKSILLYLSSGGTFSEPMPYTLQSEKFDVTFKNKYLKRVGKGAIISLEIIEIVDNTGTTYRLNERGFLVTE